MSALIDLIPPAYTEWVKIVDNDRPGIGLQYPTPADLGFSHADLYGFAIMVGIPVLMGLIVLVVVRVGENPRRGHRRK